MRVTIPYKVSDILPTLQEKNKIRRKIYLTCRDIVEVFILKNRQDFILLHTFIRNSKDDFLWGNIHSKDWEVK